MLSKLLNTGIYPELGFREQNKIRIFNTSCLVLSCMFLLYAVIFLLQGLYLPCILFLMILFVFIFNIWLIHLHKCEFAYHLALIYGLSHAFIFIMLFGEGYQAHVYFLFMPLGALILFESKKITVFYFLMSMTFLVASKIMFKFYEPYYPPNPISDVFSVMNLLFAGLLIFLAFKQFKNENMEFTEKIAHQRKLIEEKNKDITDSINYAKSIQEAILPPQKLVKQYLENSFILYKPKAIVAGDFYWMEVLNDKIFFAAVDCTGHGVPGAMVSFVGHNGLNRSVKEFGLTEPAKILDKLTLLVEETFEKSESEVKDGMDIALCSFDNKKNVIEFSGAGNSLYHFHQNSLKEIKADKQPIGKFSYRKPFTNHIINLPKGDTFYLFSDGYADQFGGPKGKKFKYKQLAELLLSIHKKPMDEQKKILDDTIEKWKGHHEQTDDITIIGVRI